MKALGFESHVFFPAASGRRSHGERNRAVVYRWLVIVALVLAVGVRAARADDRNLSGPEWVREGNRLLAADEPEKALEAYDQAATLLPESAAVSYNRGIALYRLQRFDEAETALQNALRPNANALEADVKYNLGRAAQARALSSRGDAEASLKHTQRAIQFYQDALDLRPDDPDAKRNLEQAEQFQQFLKKLIEMLKQQQEQQPNDQQSPTSQPDKQQEQQDSSQQQSGEGENSEQSTGSQSEESQDQKSGESGEQKDSGDESQQSQSSEESEQQDKAGKSDSEQKRQDQASTNADEDSQDRQNAENPQNAGDTEPSKDERSQRQQGEDQLKDAESTQPATESEQGDAGADETESMALQEAASQPATSRPAETPEERMKRLSIEQALRLLQEARDKEAQRRQALREAQRRRQGRATVDKDW